MSLQQWFALISILAFDCGVISVNDTYFLDEYKNCNNVYGAVSSPNTSTEWVISLGQQYDTKACIEACIAASNETHQCESYTFHTKKWAGEYAQFCFGRFGYPLWTPINQNYVNCGRVIWRCQDDADCSLNGKCSQSTGNCSCNTGWTGYKCGYLDLDKATYPAGYIVMNDSDSKPTSSWGGSVITSTKDHESNATKYHMFVAEYDNHCGTHSWKINSVVTHAMSTNGFNSPYQRVEVIHGHFAAEPDIIRGNNGENVLYYNTFNYSTFPECHCEDGSTPNNCKTPNPAQYITVMQYTQQSHGPYKQYFSDPVTVFSHRFNDTDLGGVINSDAQFIGMLRIHNESTGSEIYLVTASNFKDAKTYTQHDQLLFPELTPMLTEDPYLWIDCNKNYHALFHNMSPHDNPQTCGGHAFSTDGQHWVYGGVAYENKVKYANGSTFEFSRRESPHLIFADDDCTPIALTNGVEFDGGSFGDASYTLLQPIKAT